MDTTAPTIRALELKEQQHRADVAELVDVLMQIEMHYPHGINPYLDQAMSKASALIAKRGA